MAFRIEWKKSTRKDLRKLPPRQVGRIVEAVEELADEPFPFGSEKLQGSNTRTGFASATTASSMKLSSKPSLSKSNACDIGRLFTGVEMAGDAKPVTTESEET